MKEWVVGQEVYVAANRTQIRTQEHDAMRWKLRAKCPHPAIDGRGRCEHCFETIETEPLYDLKFDEIRAEAEAKALTEAWNYICECIRKRPA
jgi:hypothetical protein